MDLASIKNQHISNSDNGTTATCAGKNTASKIGLHLPVRQQETVPAELSTELTTSRIYRVGADRNVADPEVAIVVATSTVVVRASGDPGTLD